MPSLLYEKRTGARFPVKEPRTRTNSEPEGESRTCSRRFPVSPLELSFTNRASEYCETLQGICSYDVAKLLTNTRLQ
jgi:hypothetical protein